LDASNGFVGASVKKKEGHSQKWLKQTKLLPITDTKNNFKQ
jgi:hypothetical protein